MVDRKFSRTKTFSKNMTYMFCLYLFSEKCIINKNYLLPYGSLKWIVAANFLLYPWVWCIYMHECSVHSLIRLVFPWMRWISTCMNVFYICWYNFYTHESDVFTGKNVLYTLSYVFYSYGCNVRAWNLIWVSVAKPVLWQLIILLPCTLAHKSSIPMGAMSELETCFEPV